MTQGTRQALRVRTAGRTSRRFWVCLTMTWLLWLGLQVMILAAIPVAQKPAGSDGGNRQVSAWDSARKPAEGWGNRDTAVQPAPEAKVAASAPAPAPKPTSRAAVTVKLKATKPAGVSLRWADDTGSPGLPPTEPPSPTVRSAAVEPSTGPGDTSVFAAAAAPAKAPTPAPSPVTIERVRAAAPPTPPAAAAPPPASAAAPKAAAPAEQKPLPTGLERLSDDWPTWARVSVQYRGRAESSKGLLARKEYDGYYLNRIRLGATIDARPWLQAVFQAQDSQVFEYNLSPAPRNLVNTVDMRLGYVAMGSLKGGPLAVRIGRQDMAFGEGRLIASPDWGNTNRTFDVVRTTTTFRGGKFDTFAGAPVEISLNGFDPRKPGENLYGFYAALDTVLPGSVEPFAVIRTTKLAVSEVGRLGESVLYSVGGRIAGKIKPGVDYALDLVVQRGDVAGDPISAWAAHAAFIRTMNNTPWKPKVTIEYNFASGDSDAKDGTRGTFDQLYASNHARYGQADAVGWRNMHHAGMTVEMTPVKPLKLITGVHRFFLASTGDGLYGASGIRTVFLKNATSRDIGWEADVAMSYTVSKELSLGAGLGTLFSGQYLTQAGAPDRFFTPYVIWTTKF